MTPAKVIEVFTRYRADLDRNWPTIEPQRFSEEQARAPRWFLAQSARVAHFKFMCEEGCRFVEAGRIEKAMRWLGFLQGMFWATDIYTLEDLKNHSRPTEESREA